MSKLDTEVEKKEPKVENLDIDVEGEGVKPRAFKYHSEDYRLGYKAGWITARQNLLRKLSQSGVKVDEKSIEEKPIAKKKSKKEDEETIFWVAALGAVVLGGILLVFFSERNRERSQSS